MGRKENDNFYLAWVGENSMESEVGLDNEKRSQSLVALMIGVEELGIRCFV